MKNKILLQSVRLFAHHGVGVEEQAIGTYYRIDMELTTDFSQSMATDDISDTVNYAEVYQIVRERMQQPQRLLEHVGGQIVRALFDRFATVQVIKLRLIKESPPIEAVDCAGCGIEIEIDRNEIG